MAQGERIIILSGFSGSGKGTIMKMLQSRYPGEYALSVSVTTRAPRVGEEDGKDYFFRTNDEFEEMIRNHEFLEYARYVDHSYGTPKAYVEQQLAAGKNVVLEIEIQGALQIKQLYPDTLLLFVTPPSAQILKERLCGRGTETKDAIDSRLTQALQEAEGCEVYDYLIINDQLDEAVEEVHRIICSEQRKMKKNLGQITEIKEQLKEFVKGDAK